MPWCPNCRDEYREGITVCADCGAELVDDLSLYPEKTEEFSEYEGYEVEEEPVKVVSAEDLSHLSPEQLMELAKKASAFNMQYDEDAQAPANPQASSVYINNEEKAEENKSSAYTLLVIGGLGIVAVVLFFFDIIHFNINKFGRYTITGVMGALFILFFVMGIVSLKNFRAFKKKAVKENNLTIEIKKWCLDNFFKDEIDSFCRFGQTPEEVKYFERTKIMKSRINNQFMNLDDAYVNRLIEEIYPEVFENRM